MLEGLSKILQASECYIKILRSNKVVTFLKEVDFGSLSKEPTKPSLLVDKLVLHAFHLCHVLLLGFLLFYLNPQSLTLSRALDLFIFTKFFFDMKR